MLKSLESWIVKVPLLEEWVASPELGGHFSGSTRLIVLLEDEEGFQGWGEGPATGTPETIADALGTLPLRELSTLRPSCLNLAPTYFHRPPPPSPHTPNLANLQHRIRHPLQSSVEMALLDLLARRADVPLVTSLGGGWRDRVAVDYWMGRVTPEHAMRCVKRGRELGFTGVKIKTTLEDDNVARLEAIRDAVGPEWKVTVDPNGRFYRFDDAIATIRAMDAVANMAILEDPFPRIHLHDFARLRPLLQARLVMHIDPPESLFSVLKSDAVGGLNLDSHAQGLLAWRMQAAAADMANLPVWHGSGLDLGIATAAQVHLAAATPNCQLPGDQAGPWLRESSLLQTPLMIKAGHIPVPTGPGLGITVDRTALERFTTWHWQS